MRWLLQLFHAIRPSITPDDDYPLIQDDMYLYTVQESRPEPESMAAKWLRMNEALPQEADDD